MSDLVLKSETSDAEQFIEMVAVTDGDHETLPLELALWYAESNIRQLFFSYINPIQDGE